ncbi:hypothetical protein EsDP_00000650 [Epichloe bromicola]|uniref:HCNGP-like protein n=1 Tax=Epichloe bromicola TaxID=79588 RepID=A0ABQ0CFI6_9HYPO
MAAGLVGYASSDDEDDTPSQIISPKACGNDDSREAETQKLTSSSTSPQIKRPNWNQHPARYKMSPPSQSTIGPVPLGPSLPPIASDLPEMSPGFFPPEEADPNRPSSPYSSTRAIVHDLTLPSIPNLTIPPSPPGSPPPATNRKFQQFLDLKRKGTHFNTKLESSTALRNPSLTDKLLSFVDLTGSAQYETTLPLDLYDPSGFPKWAHREELRKSREALVKERQGEKVASRGIDFVNSSSHSTPVGGGQAAGGLLKTEKRKSAWN